MFFNSIIIQERASKGKHIIQEQNLQETCEDQEALVQDGRRTSIDGAEGNNKNHNQDMELRSKPHDTKPNIHVSRKDIEKPTYI